LATGATGSGKSCAMANYLDFLQHCPQKKGENKVLDRIFLVSPTALANQHNFDSLDVDEDDLYEDYNDGVLEEIIEKCEEDYEEFERWEEDKAELKQLIKDIKDPKRAIEDLDCELLVKWAERNFEEPEYKYDRMPCFAIIFDDLSHTRLFANTGKNPAINTLLRRRHIAGTGLNVFIATQSFKSGLMKCARGSLTNALIFKTKNAQEVEDMADSVANVCDKDTFKKVFDFAIQEPHDFLFIDYDAPDHERFRRNFNQIIKLNGENKKEDNNIKKDVLPTRNNKTKPTSIRRSKHPIITASKAKAIAEGL